VLCAEVELAASGQALELQIEVVESLWVMGVQFGVLLLQEVVEVDLLQSMELSSGPTSFD